MLIFSVGHGGRFGHEYVKVILDEFGGLFYLNQSRYKQESAIKKKANLSPDMVQTIKDLINSYDFEGLENDKANIVTKELKEATGSGMKELEILSAKKHIFFALPMQYDAKSERLKGLYELIDKLNNLFIYLIQTHTKASPFG